MNVLMVCDNDETLIQMRAYLRGAGIEARATRRLSEARAQTLTAGALLLFPDDFDRAQVGRFVTQALASPAHPLAVLVTGDPHYFEALLRPVSTAQAPVILPKPTWGWTILDVLRAHGSTVSSAHGASLAEERAPRPTRRG